MLYYGRIDISERINLTKSSSNIECMICHYCFFNHGFKFQDSICNGCHGLIILSVNINDIAIITVKMLIIVVFFITANLKQLVIKKFCS